MTHKRHPITIIGAGVAGTAAAEVLHQAGYTPHLMEARPTPGGRCATGVHQGRWFDYGAQYFTARDSRFQANIQKDRADGRLVHWAPAIAHAEHIADTWLLSPAPDPQARLIAPTGLQRWIAGRLAANNLTPVHDTVTAIQAQPEGWQLLDERGDSTLTSRLICTPPDATLAALFGHLVRQIPPLNQPDPALLPCHACLVATAAPMAYQAIFFDSYCLAWAADNSHKAGWASGQHLWTLHTTAEFSRRHRHTPVREVAQHIVEHFARATARPVEAMTTLHCQYWPHARPGRGILELANDCWAEPQAGLALAGDWLAGGRIEGAWLSGQAAARQLMRS